MQKTDDSRTGGRRSRDLGIPFDGTPGRFNAITDVPGLELGYCTLKEGAPILKVGTSPIRTGVTAILPRGRKSFMAPLFAGSHVLNGCGEMTGIVWVEESGEYAGPIILTNSHSVGVARDATIKWVARQLPEDTPAWMLPMPVVTETFDGLLNDINGFHVKDEHVFAAIESAASGPVEQGSVGGGTGMTSFEFKSGSGTSSRLTEIDGKSYTVGVFVQSNFGLRPELRICGVPVGRHLKGGEWRSKPPEGSSIIVIIATDAPLLPHQLKRLARRASLGLARVGSIAHNSSGDIFFAFSTADIKDVGGSRLSAEFLSNDAIDAAFAAVVEATEEAIVDSLVVNEAMEGPNGFLVRSLPVSDLLQVLSDHGAIGR